MEKLFISLLVLGMAVAANAMTLQISVEGVLDPVDTQIVAKPPSVQLLLGIHSPDGYRPFDDLYYALVVDTSLGSMSGGVVTAAAPPDSGIYGYNAQAVGLCQPPYDGIWGSIMNIAGTPVDPGIYIDEILYHAESMRADAILHLWSTPDFANFTLEDTLLLHQEVCEPGTVLLLSLGGLALVRRRFNRNAIETHRF